MTSITKKNQKLFEDIKGLISQAKTSVAISINEQMTILYWNIGKRIRQEVIKSDRAEYSEHVVSSLAKGLVELL